MGIYHELSEDPLSASFLNTAHILNTICDLKEHEKFTSEPGLHGILHTSRDFLCYLNFVQRSHV